MIGVRTPIADISPTRFIFPNVEAVKIADAAQTDGPPSGVQIKPSTRSPEV
jgi:hypothetical protein